MNCSRHFLCTFVQVFQPDKFLEMELLGQSLCSFSGELCDIRMTSPPKGDVFEDVPFPTTAILQVQVVALPVPLGELLVAFQMYTGPVPSSGNATNKLWVYRILVPPKGQALKGNKGSYHMVGREAGTESQR